MWFKKNKSKKNINTSVQTNKVKGGINITSNGMTAVEQLILSRLDNIEGKIDKNADNTLKNHLHIKKLRNGLSMYVQNNGVKPSVKKAVKLILED